MLFKVINALMLACFLLSIAVQYNDPDPLVWMALYAVPAVLTLLAFWNIHTAFAALAALGYFIGFAVWMPGWGWDSWMLLTEPKMTNEDVELAREAVGLLISAAWMAVLFVRGYRSRHAPRAVPHAPSITSTSSMHSPKDPS